MNITIFWDVTPCSQLKINRRFEGISPPSSGSNKRSKKGGKPSEDGGDMFLRNVG
jgi:hypothetical protein